MEIGKGHECLAGPSVLSFVQRAVGGEENKDLVRTGKGCWEGPGLGQVLLTPGVWSPCHSDSTCPAW